MDYKEQMKTYTRFLSTKKRRSSIEDEQALNVYDNEQYFYEVLLAQKYCSVKIVILNFI